MATSQILRSKSLELHPFGPQHLTAHYVGWLNDKQTMRYSEQRHHIHTIESCRAYADAFANSPNYFWAVVATDPRLGHIGNLTSNVDRNNRIADLAILIGEPSARQRGLGREAWQSACRFLLNEAGMRKVTAGTMSVNEPMLRIMRTSGMIEEGRRRGDFLFEGKPVDRVMVALFADK